MEELEESSGHVSTESFIIQKLLRYLFSKDQRGQAKWWAEWFNVAERSIWSYIKFDLISKNTHSIIS